MLLLCPNITYYQTIKVMSTVLIFTIKSFMEISVDYPGILNINIYLTRIYFTSTEDFCHHVSQWLTAFSTRKCKNVSIAYATCQNEIYLYTLALWILWRENSINNTTYIHHLHGFTLNIMVPFLYYGVSVIILYNTLSFWDIFVGSVCNMFNIVRHQILPLTSSLT